MKVTYTLEFDTEAGTVRVSKPCGDGETWHQATVTVESDVQRDHEGKLLLTGKRTLTLEGILRHG